MRAGTMPVEAGIWSLGKPGLREPLAERGFVSDTILDVIGTADELSAIQKVAPDTFDRVLVELIERLHREITRDEDPIWNAEWDIDV